MDDRRDNPFFARAIANRLWSHYLGRGLVEPLDDMRATNPATNEPLLDELAKHMREVKYDLKAFTRTLLNSRLYQLAGFQETRDGKTDGPRIDEQNFSHSLPRALAAEVLLDAISQATGVAEKFNGFPDGYRAIQIWDNRMPSYFFRIFGRPVRASVCECERSNEPSIAQALHLMNSEEIMGKIRSRHGNARRLAASKMTPGRSSTNSIWALCRGLPNEAEQARMLRRLRRGRRRSPGGRRGRSLGAAEHAEFCVQPLTFQRWRAEPRKGPEYVPVHSGPLRGSARHLFTSASGSEKSSVCRWFSGRVQGQNPG